MFDATRDVQYLEDIVNRFRKLKPDTKYGEHILFMTLHYAHLTEPLNLEEMFSASDQDLIDAINEIVANLDTEHSCYKNNFHSRYNAVCPDPCGAPCAGIYACTNA